MLQSLAPVPSNETDGLNVAEPFDNTADTAEVGVTETFAVTSAGAANAPGASVRTIAIARTSESSLRFIVFIKSFLS